MTPIASAPPAGAPPHLRPLRWLVGVTVLTVATLWFLAFMTITAHSAPTATPWLLALVGLILLTAALAAAFLLTASRLLETRKALALHIDHLQGQLEALQRRLEAAERSRGAEVKAKHDLVAAVSEELRRPLAEVLGFATIVLESNEEVGPSIRDLVVLILEETAEMLNVVDDLLIATRAATGALSLAREKVTLADEVHTVVSRWNSIEVGRMTVQGNGATAIGDAARVRQVLRNLLSNALRYGGRRIEISVAQRRGRAIVTVADSGDPIPDEVQQRMFDLYYRGTTASTGTAPSLGIGLGLSRHLAEAMGGTLDFRRIEDHNVFELRLPAAQADAGLSRAV